MVLAVQWNLQPRVVDHRTVVLHSLLLHCNHFHSLQFGLERVRLLLSSLLVAFSFALISVVVPLRFQFYEYFNYSNNQSIKPQEGLCWLEFAMFVLLTKSKFLQSPDLILLAYF